MDTTTQVTSAPKVSILMLTYNRASYIKEAIQSVLKQTYPDFELHIIDDGSTDATAELVVKFTDSRVKYHRSSTNKGLIERRKESLTYANGMYIAILDSDDAWNDPGKLQAQVAYMEANPDCAVVGTFINRINQAGETIGTDKYAESDSTIRKTILVRNQFAHSSVLLRTAFVEKTAGYRDTTLAEDLDLFLQLGQVGTFANLPVYTTNYRIHGESFGSKRVLMAKAILHIIKNYRDTYPNAWKGLLVGYLRLLLSYVR